MKSPQAVLPLTWAVSVCCVSDDFGAGHSGYMCAQPAERAGELEDRAGQGAEHDGRDPLLAAGSGLH